jgi:Flp pilus assembly protein TadD
LWQHTIEACGESSPGYTLLGFAYMEAWQNDLAIQYYHEALRLEPNNAYALLNLGVALDRQGKLEEAVEWYRKALKKYSSWARPHDNLGFALARLGRKKEAIAEYEEAIRCDPRWNTAHERLGQLFFADGKLQEAARHFRAAFDDGWRNPIIYAGLGETLILQGKSAEAVEVLREWASSQQGEWRPRSLLGLALYESGKRDEAGKQFQIASNMNRAWPEILNQEAWVLATDPVAKNRNGQLALVVAKQACRATGDREARYLDTLAAAHAEAGQFSGAIQVAKQAIETAKAAQAEHLIPAIKQRLELYEKAQPYRNNPEASAN